MNTTENTRGPIHQPDVFNIETFDGRRWHGGMNRIEGADAIRVAAQWAAEDGRRYRVFDPENQLVFDTGADAVQVIAARYRATEPGDRSVCGYVLVYAGRAFGWKRELAAPETVCPGAIAVDILGRMYEAQGGNDYDGALRWVPAPRAPTRPEVS